MGFQIGSIFPGYVESFGHVRQARSLNIGTAAGAVAVGGIAGGASALMWKEKDGDARVPESIAVGLAMAGVGAIAGRVMSAHNGLGPKIADLVGQSQYEYYTGKSHMVNTTKTVPVTGSNGLPVLENGLPLTVTVPTTQVVRETATAWREGVGFAALNRRRGEKDGYDTLAKARDQFSDVDRDTHVVVIKSQGQLGERFHAFTATKIGVERLQRVENRHPSVVPSSVPA